MIVFIDLRNYEEDFGGNHFAFWDTITSSFLKDVSACQAWTSLEDFEDSMGDDDRVERCKRLMPDWALKGQPYSVD